ncbi:MAG: histidine phosphatase family protein [Bacteroidetes bacterium]|nr:histidine phosphatase family protein [Bacteroidota bacterium]
MKKYALLLVMSIGVSVVYAQTSTYILLRHAEKDTTAAGATRMKADLPLTEQGWRRAKKLVQTLAE